MSITAERRTTLVSEYKLADADTGSPEVQVRPGCPSGSAT